MRPDATRDAGLRELGVHARLKKIACFPDGRDRPHEVRIHLFDAYKSELKKEKKRLAKELHPDKNLEETEEVRDSRTKRYTEVIQAIDFVMGLTINPPPFRPPLPLFRGMPIMNQQTGMGFQPTQTSTEAFWRVVASR